LSERIKFEVEL